MLIQWLGGGWRVNFYFCWQPQHGRRSVVPLDFEATLGGWIVPLVVGVYRFGAPNAVGVM